ncbi:MAG: isoamylase early set domain-containing protein [Actinomycetota bacterium]
MFEQDDDVLERVIERLHGPVRLDPSFDARVMARVAMAQRRSARLAEAWSWLRRPRPVAVSPLAGLAAAAALAGMALWLGVRGPVRFAPSAGAETTVVQFVLVSAGASTVALVGDFNDWDAAATPMRSTTHDGLWSVAVPLPPGRHRYAFLVNGASWFADPSAPRALDDFGTPSSVVTVGG